MLTLTGHLQGMFYDLKTQLVQLLTEKVAENLQFTNHIKKAKKVLESQKLTFDKGQY